MVIPKLIFDSVSKGGDTITVHDGTGIYNSVTNPNGWGFPNESSGDVLKIIFTVQNMNSDKVYRQNYVRAFDPSKPFDLVSPTINQIIAGAPISFNSYSLQITTTGLQPFEDGVYDINMYDVMNGVISATGIAGNPFLIGTNLQDIYQYDSILIGDNLYNIDKSKNDNGGTVLYLVEPLLASATSFYRVRRANIKAFISEATLGNLTFNILADCGCGKGREVHKFAYAIGNYINAEDAFEQGDYEGASKFLRAVGKSLNCC